MRIWFATITLFVLTAVTSHAADLRVAAASDLNFAIKEIIAQYERDSGNHIQLTLGSSGTFFTQISQGAPFDVYLSADRTYPEQLLKQNLAESGSLFVYGIGKIVLWVPSQSPIDVGKLGMQSLLHASVRKISIANPDHAPYGRAAVAAIQHSGIYDRVKDRFVLGENISQAAEFVHSGAAQIGVIALSLALSDPMRGAGKYWEVPLDFYPRLEQTGVILRRARDSGNLQAAQAFVRALQSSRAREILNRYGFTDAQP